MRIVNMKEENDAVEFSCFKNIDLLQEASLIEEPQKKFNDSGNSFKITVPKSAIQTYKIRF